MRTLPVCLSERKGFQSRLRVHQLKLYGVSPGLVHVKTVAVFFTHVQYLTETLLSNMQRGKHYQQYQLYFSPKLWKTLTAADLKIWPTVWMKYSTIAIVALDVNETFRDIGIAFVHAS